MNQPRFIHSAKPFKEYARKYKDAGFVPLPLPYGKKAPPPTDFTGHGAKEVTNEILDKWIAEKSDGNIGIKADYVWVEGEKFEIVIIDVDHHPDDPNDPKDGGTSLKVLCDKLGQLPQTWINTARDNGIAGHYFYLAPPDLMWKGKPAKGIDMRLRYWSYGAVFPSHNPDSNSQYYWYPPGFKPDGNVDAIDREKYGLIPDATKLPKLPETWVKFLTDEKTKYINSPMDMNSSYDSLKSWAIKSFAPKDDICPYMTSLLANHLKKLEESDSNHDILLNAHWGILRSGSVEGHTGWAAILKEFNKAYRQNILDKNNKRPLKEVNGEIDRSIKGTLRKLKGLHDEKSKNGIVYFDINDPCSLVASVNYIAPVSNSADGGDGGIRIPASALPKTPIEYEKNDDGNGELFLDLYSGNVKFVPNVYGAWILWDGSRWMLDDNSKDREHGIVRDLFRGVKRLQIAEAIRLLEEARRNNDAAKEKIALNFKNWAKRSGDRGPVTNALIQASTMGEKGAWIKYENLDSNPMMLGLANGVIRFNSKEDREKGSPPFELVNVAKDMMVTMSTNVPYIPMIEQENHPDLAVRESYRKFWDYMKTFMQQHISEESWNYLPKLFGFSILGHNEHKKAIFLHGETHTGKSTFQYMLSDTLGDYALWRSPNIFQNSRFKGELAEGLSKSMVMIDEVGKSEIHAELFKAITGNTPITCELKNSNIGVTMRARCTIVSACNAPPLIPDDDEATRQRFIVIPFRHQVTPGVNMDTLALDDLRKHCRVTMLAWLIEGCADAIMDGGVGNVPDELSLETTSFTSNLSELAGFIEDKLVMSDENDWATYGLKGDDPRLGKQPWPNEKCTFENDMWDSFKMWQTDNVPQRDWISKNQMTRRLKQAGLTYDANAMSGKRRWIGVRLKTTQKITLDSNGQVT